VHSSPEIVVWLDEPTQSRNATKTIP
jgi:hypothetical protein